jgi:RNA polymerase sigma-70 factor (ECF subfamily)
MSQRPTGGEGSSAFDSVLAAAQLGEAWAAAELFNDLQPRVLRFLRAQDSRAADDLAAEVWLGVAKGIGSFVGDDRSFRAWVFTMARRRLIDHRRRVVRQRTDAVQLEGLPDPVAGDAPEQQALDLLGAQDAAAFVVSTLSADQAEVVLLRVLAGLDVPEVAAIVGRSPNWVRVTQHRALRKLATRLGSTQGVMR